MINTKYAKQIKPGESIVESDGALLQVAKVESDYRNTSIITVHFEQFSMTRIAPQKIHGMCRLHVQEAA